MSPYLLLSLLLGAIYGTVFHLWQGKTWRDLALYLVTALFGFGLGQLIGNFMGLNIFPIGSLHLFEATLISGLMLFIIRWVKM